MCVCAFQLENMVGGLQQYQQRVTQHLVPCVGQFIVALNDDAQWKTVNYQILLRSRHAHSQVRTHTNTGEQSGCTIYCKVIFIAMSTCVLDVS